MLISRRAQRDRRMAQAALGARASGPSRSCDAGTGRRPALLRVELFPRDRLDGEGLVAELSPRRGLGAGPGGVQRAGPAATDARRPACARLPPAHRGRGQCGRTCASPSPPHPSTWRALMALLRGQGRTARVLLLDRAREALLRAEPSAT